MFKDAVHHYVFVWSPRMKKMVINMTLNWNKVWRPLNDALVWTLHINISPASFNHSWCNDTGWGTHQTTQEKWLWSSDVTLERERLNRHALRGNTEQNNGFVHLPCTWLGNIRQRIETAGWQSGLIRVLWVFCPWVLLKGGFESADVRSDSLGTRVLG